MKAIAFVMLIAAIFSGGVLAAAVNFDDLKVGAPPPGWTATKTGTGEAKWTIEKDDTAPSPPNVLKQSGVATYPVCLKDDTSLKDGFVEVKFKPISGKEDQAGGVVWRAKDSNNYYVARANALEDNVTIYDTVNGRRTERKRASMKVASNQWHTLRVDFQGNHFAVTYDGQKAIEWDDETFKEAGKVGVWTKADSVTEFDDFSYSPGQAAGQAPLALLRRIELPNVEGRMDHLTFDAANQRLFIAALENNTLEIVDLRASVRAKSVTGLHEPTGIVLVPDANAVAVANGASGALQMFDRADFHVAKTIAVGADADNVRYDPVKKRLYVGYGSGAIAIVDPANGQRVGEVKLAGHPESFQLERSSSRIFVNVPTARHVAVLDRDTMKVTATWPVVGAESNFPMALDEANHRLFIGCRSPAKLLIYDTSTGKPVGSFETVGDTDDIFYDSMRKRLYVSGGEGFVDVFEQPDANHLTRVAHVATVAGARTSLLVSEQNRLYLAVPHRGSQKAEIRVYEAR